uniref:Uncharacterized protein n=1 Tax=Physcomitrium patens TaxID=3218 RepID=A0A7I4BA54_PHYPA
MEDELGTLSSRGIVLRSPQAFWRTPERPYRQRFYSVKPCSKEMKCDVEVSSHAVRDIEEYRNFCDRPKNQRPQPDEVLQGSISTPSIFLPVNDDNVAYMRGQLHQGAIQVLGMERPSARRSSPFTKTGKFIAGTVLMMTMAIKFGE